MSRFLAPAFVFAREPQTREFLWFCVPALLLGLALRVALIADLPFAYFHDDAPDFLTTPDRLLHQAKWEVHQKKTFLTPILFTLPFLVKVPALIAIPVGQHLLGLAVVVLVGLLCRLWFALWKVFIVPLTMLAAANPFFLWYEHTLMAESAFVFCTVLVACAGTVYVLNPSRGRCAFLIVALFLEAGARPEGKLLFGFGLLLLAIVHWGSPRIALPRIALLGAVGLIAQLTTRTSQAGLLLYTSVVKLTPVELRCAPGLEEYIAPIRADLQQRWAAKPNFPRVRDRRAVAAAVEGYLREHPERATVRKHGDVNAFCLKLAVETCARNFLLLPAHVLHKFRFVATESPAARFDQAALFEKQREAYADQAPLVMRLSRGLIGHPLANETELQQFIDTQYHEVPWFNALSDRWLATVSALRFPDQAYPDPPSLAFIYPGVPLYFAAAALGLLAAMLRPGTLQPFHLAWGLALAGFFFVIILTANVRPRFRFVFEPFWFLYLAMLVESVWLSLKAVLRR